MLGTPDYMSPEQWQESSTVGSAADIYSLGCTLFALLTGTPPFHSHGSSSVAAKMTAHVMESAPDIRDSKSLVPVELAKIIERCLLKDPKDRLQTPGELAEALKPFCSDSNLKDFRVEESSVGAESLMPTDNLNSEPTESIDQIQESKPKSVQNSASFKTKLWIGGIVAIALTVTFLITQPWQGQTGPSDEQVAKESPIVQKTKMVAFRTAFEEPVLLGRINHNEPGGQVVFQGERSRLEILFPEKRYSMVLG